MVNIQLASGQYFITENTGVFSQDLNFTFNGAAPPLSSDFYLEGSQFLSIYGNDQSPKITVSLNNLNIYDGLTNQPSNVISILGSNTNITLNNVHIHNCTGFEWILIMTANIVNPKGGPSCFLALNNCSFTNNMVTDQLLNLQQANVTIDNCLFDQFSSAALVLYQSHIEITNSVYSNSNNSLVVPNFYDTPLIQGQDSITMDNCTFSNLSWRETLVVIGPNSFLSNINLVNITHSDYYLDVYGDTILTNIRVGGTFSSGSVLIECQEKANLTISGINMSSADHGGPSITKCNISSTCNIAGVNVPHCPTKHHLNGAEIAGITIGAVAGLIIILLVILHLIKKRNTSSYQSINQ
ncbi:hypothetical protein SAMD00019534_090050 [Acytostelium subglobosum LB1]|uniref:hypothetical protein n=1 Tax=Acytostelium subglobosum LB1 TaxID=1410327 RepID=UPI0006451BF1|nr:hypothetical protein SAMD00019534_090050 [Acytostelium subglobosum LB1]GAM25830.1 hypothetical protein SAMD00019534_090050 [Acytostelium subglobosum LB1]|eukprot:XP_012751348.1 hypothetical protein SAMD00019534_090050 [Acytostelium subglobosum LB1]